MTETGSERRSLARELLAVCVSIESETARIEELKTRLKAIADIAGIYKESFEGGASISVSPSKGGAFKGVMPVLDPELYLALDPDERARLQGMGLVREEAQYGRGSYASVRIVMPARPPT